MFAGFRQRRQRYVEMLPPDWVLCFFLTSHCAMRFRNLLHVQRRSRYVFQARLAIYTTKHGCFLNSLQFIECPAVYLSAYPFPLCLLLASWQVWVRVACSCASPMIPSPPPSLRPLGTCTRIIALLCSRQDWGHCTSGWPLVSTSFSPQMSPCQGC